MNKQQLRKYFVHDLKWGWGCQQEIVFNFLCEAAAEADGGVVLDAGAGHQRYKPFFDSSIYIAQEHPIAGQQNKKIQEYDILSDIKTIPLRDHSVDLILSTSSLEHMEFPDLFFAESFRVLKPGGSLYINVPFAYEEHEIPYDFQRLTRYGLNRNYSQAGFERISVSPTSSSIYSAQYLLLYSCMEIYKRPDQALWAKMMSLSMYLTALLICKVSMRLFDKGPINETKLPIGWIVKGYKKGSKNEDLKEMSKKEFITNNAQLNSTMVLIDGCILPK